MIPVLVSACLVGQPTRYDGHAALFKHAILDRWLEEERVVAFCPETAGGLATPRIPAEIIGGDGSAVLAGRARVVDRNGQDVSVNFIQGARQALAVARSQKIALALLKGNSPSCGNTTIYDGSFSGGKLKGSGVAAALLRQNGILVFNETQIEQAGAYLAGL
jgi:uncharacterized protein YbbK (DUF523 family)